MKSIGVLTTGRDVSGANAAIRAVVRKAKKNGIRVFGINNGFNGMIENDMKMLSTRDVSGRIGKASSFLGSSYQYQPFKEDAVKKMVDNLAKKNIEGLVIIGGGGAFGLSKPLSDKGLQIVGVPASIQDDVIGTDICLGVDSAVNNIMNCVDHIRSCDSSRNRSFLVQVDGQYSGSLASRAAVVCGAEIVLTPERSTEKLDAIAKRMNEALNTGKTQCIAILSSGWKPGIDALSNYLEEHEKEADLLVRRTILGYIQRGGAPSGFDRILGTKMGAAAVTAIIDGCRNQFIGLQNDKLERIPFEETIGKYRQADPVMLDMLKDTY